jgi:uncharacterized membrane protein YeiH
MVVRRSLLALDLAGTFLFGLEGALAGVASGLDLLGVLVVAFATGLGGGILRDVVIGALPPQAIRDWRYAAVALAAGLTTFLAHGAASGTAAGVFVYLDAAALGLFAVAGAQKALEYDIQPSSAILLGGLTAVGGGVVRDVLTGRVPIVLRSDFYATAALLGAAAFVVARRAGLPQPTAAALGFAICFVARSIGYAYHWRLPGAGG